MLFHVIDGDCESWPRHEKRLNGFSQDLVGLSHHRSFRDLGMRNQRGGLVGPLDAILDRWIAQECPSIRSTDKARKRKQLRSIIERRGLMVNDVTMAKDLQILNPNITKQIILEEGAKRYAM